MILAVYNLAVGLLTPLAVPYLIARSWSRGQPARRIPERFGFLPPSVSQTRPGAVWLHAVSVGEALSTRRLVEKLRERFPSEKIYVSTSTPTGQELAREKLCGLADGFFYVPADFAWAVRRALRALKPRLVVVLETEIWPNLYREVKRAGAGLLLVNGRISDQSLPSYRRFRRLFEAVLRFPDAILAQSEQDAERFVGIGAPRESVSTNGNLKYDFDPAETDLPSEVAVFLEALAPEPADRRRQHARERRETGGGGLPRVDESAPARAARHCAAASVALRRGGGDDPRGRPASAAAQRA